MQKQMIIMIGIPYSGKTHYVKNFINRNPHQVIEAMTLGQALRTEGFEINSQKMQPVYTVSRVMAKSFMKRHYPIIVDERNTTLESIFLWKQLGIANDYSVVGKLIDTPKEVCFKRAKEAECGEEMLEYIEKCSEQLIELKTMLGFKHQRILDNYEVIKMEVEDEIL